MNRREFLKLATFTSLSTLLPGVPGWAFSNGSDNPSGKKLIVILLRGAVDGLNVVVPYGDPLYYSLRPTIAIPRPGTDLGVLNLDGHFGLHPAMAPLMPFWQDKTMAFVHASGSPDPSRSHFDAQDYMESGIPGSRTANSGWLNRLVMNLPKQHSALQAVSLGPVLPRIFAGPASIATVSKALNNGKSVMDRPAIESAFTDLYANRHDDYGKAFAEGLAAHKEIKEALRQDEKDKMDGEQAEANRGAPSPRNYANFGKQVAQLLRRSPSIQVAFLDFGGWDTHVSQGAGKGQLANHLSPLANGLADLINGLGPMYKNTSIVVMSEFGRTAKENGNGGTDHGHGNAMWLLGGDIQGGKVYGRWSGLSSGSLYEGRDLPATTDFRDVLSSLLNNQFEVAKTTLTNVFPNYECKRSPFIQA